MGRQKVQKNNMQQVALDSSHYSILYPNDNLFQLTARRLAAFYGWQPGDLEMVVEARTTKIVQQKKIFLSVLARISQLPRDQSGSKLEFITRPLTLAITFFS